MELFDTHCHLDVEEFDTDRSVVIENCKSLGVNHILLPAITRKHWDRLLKLSDTDSIFYPALGLHPYYLNEHQDKHVDELRHYLDKRTDIVAVGEIGLDYFVKDLDQQKQIQLFEAQLQVAKDFDLPVILHVRKSHDQVLTLLKKYKVRKGIMHAFSGSEQQAQQFYDWGLKLGFGGPATYDRAQKLHRIIRSLPTDAFVLETDAPDLPPASHHGERNSPEYLPQIAEKISELRGETIEELAAYCTANARQVLQLSA